MSWRPEYVLLILFSTLVDYFVGIRLEREEEKTKKKMLLLLSLLVNLGLLFLFKYYNFFSDSLRLLIQTYSLNVNVPTLKLLLPVGISFYTFQTLSYTIDVYFGKIKAERHFGIFAVYVSFFPQLVAGPIERAKNLLPQFKKHKTFDVGRITDGLRLMLWGFFKKIVIADRLAMFVNMVYNDVGSFSGPYYMLATVFFAFQIYCDFSGYSDIAIGAAKIMGYDLMKNFNRPYFAKSISEFWKRWHISLSTWFRDYLYIPLGGSRVKKYRWYMNLMIVFVVSGLWHGANWTFVIWGALHGIYLILEIVLKNFNGKIKEIVNFKEYRKYISVIQILSTFILVNIGWVFFRANSLSDAFFIFSNIFTGFADFRIDILTISLGKTQFVIAVFSIVFLEMIHFLQEHVDVKKIFLERHVCLRWSVYMMAVISILLFGIFEKSEFIYFQF